MQISHEELIEEIVKCLNELDPEVLAEVANKVMRNKVAYLEDSLYEVNLTLVDEAIEGWPCEKIAENWSVNRFKWLPVTEEFYDEMLGTLPPQKMFNGGFMVGEPYDHCRRPDGKFEATYTTIVKVGDNYYSKHCFTSTVEDDYAELKKFLAS